MLCYCRDESPLLWPANSGEFLQHFPHVILGGQVQWWLCLTLSYNYWEEQKEWKQRRCKKGVLEGTSQSGCDAWDVVAFVEKCKHIWVQRWAKAGTGLGLFAVSHKEASNERKEEREKLLTSRLWCPEERKKGTAASNPAGLEAPQGHRGGQGEGRWWPETGEEEGEC